MTINYTSATAAADVIALHKPGFKPIIGITLGSGLGEIADSIEDPTVIPYYKLPGFHHGAVEGHANNLILGYLNKTPVICLQGRPHFYEGVSNEIFRTWPRTLKTLGCQVLILTNAVGSLNQDVPAGSISAITDHINFQGTNPLIGPNDNDFGERFFSMENAYDKELRETALDIAKKLDIKLHQGVYLGVTGPCFETPAEINAFRILGADTVGMSVIQEAVAARHCRLKVLGLSVVTNLAAGMNEEELSHEQTLRCAKLGAGDLTKLVLTFCKEYKNAK